MIAKLQPAFLSNVHVLKLLPRLFLFLKILSFLTHRLNVNDTDCDMSFVLNKSDEDYLHTQNDNIEMVPVGGVSFEPTEETSINTNMPQTMETLETCASTQVPYSTENLAGQCSFQNLPTVSILMDPVSNHFVQVSGVTNTIGIINQNGNQVTEKLVCTTAVETNPSVSTNSVSSAVNALGTMTLVDAVDIKNSSNLLTPITITDSNLNPTNLQNFIPIELLTTNPTNTGVINQEQIYVLPLKVEDDIIEDEKKDTLQSFNEPLRTSTPTLVEDGMDEMILSGNVEDEKKNTLRDTDKKKENEDKKKSTQSVETEHHANKVESGIEEIQELRNETEENLSKKEEIQARTITEDMKITKSMPNKNPTRYSNVQTTMKRKKEMEVALLRDDKEKEDKQKTHNTTYCRDWVANTNVNQDTNSSVQSDHVQEVSHSVESYPLLDLISV